MVCRFRFCHAVSTFNLQVVPFMIGILQTLWQFRGRLGYKLLETPISGALLHIMWIMAFGTNEPALLAITGPFTNAFAVDTLAPVPIDGAMTLTTQLLRLIKTNLATEIINKFVTLFSIMAIETPDSSPAVLQIECIGHKIHMHGQFARIFIF